MLNKSSFVIEKPYLVKASLESETLAAFLYLEWAKDWQAKYCETGVILQISVEENITPTIY